jgi:preprotein translocase subunit SecD
MRYFGWTLLAIVIVFVCAVFVDLPSTSTVFGKNVAVKKGLDLAGGARVLLCANKGQHPSSTDMSTAAQVITQRAAGGAGVSEPQVSIVNNTCVNVEMPGLKNQKQVINTLGTTGYLAITDSGTTPLNAGTPVKLVCKDKGCGASNTVGVTDTTKKVPVLQVIAPGKDVSAGSAQAGYDSTTGGPIVNYTLQGKGNDNWCTFTTNSVGRYSAIVLDNKVISDPTIQQPICGGQTQISGLTSIDEAKSISTYLNYGALPIKLHIDSSQQVASTLGPQYVSLATKATIIGLIIVALFMLLYYRLPGLLADAALIVYAAVVFALFKLLGVTLTLAGIAGFVLSIGMAVDANVLIFERMKEELRSGKSIGAAVEAGFRRAFPSIRDSNMSTIITTVILFWFGHNFAATVITGFATTLFLGVVISFFTAVFVSHTFLRLLVRTGRWRNLSLFGVEQQQLPGGQQVA